MQRFRIVVRDMSQDMRGRLVSSLLLLLVSYLLVPL